jgi:UDP-GlcNAc:undecaprenyl-phosphate GlcNAc-1-phosphate transferase
VPEAIRQVFGYVALGFAFSVALTPLCRSAAFRLGYVATPSGDRWHKKPTALLGGVAIGLSVLIGWFVSGAAVETLLLLVCGLGLLCVGLVDDIVSLKPSTKLVFQIVAASILVFSGYQLRWVESLTLDSLITILWIVGVTNAFNLLDNMDGLCAGIASIAAVALLMGAAAGSGPMPTTVYGSLLLGSMLGFLVYNFSPASIFMGDSGSLFIGLTLSALTLSSASPNVTEPNVISVVAAPLLVLLIPLFDTALVTMSRLRSGRSPSRGGRDHTSHRLVAIGLSERRAVLVLWGLAILGGSAGLLMRHVSLTWTTPLTVIILLAMAIFGAYLMNIRVYEDADDSSARQGRMTRFVADFMYKRRVAEILLDFCLVAASYYLAYRLRFEGREFSANFTKFLGSLPLVIALQVTFLFAFRVYRGVWRYFSLMDAVAVAKGVLAGTAAVICVFVFIERFSGYSRAVFVIHSALLMLMITGSRASFRLISEFVRRRRIGSGLVVYGAGSRSHWALREMLEHPELQFRMRGFIDDDAAKHRMRVHGYPVLGGYDALARLINAGKVECVVISSQLVRSDRVRDTEQLCRQRGVRLFRFYVDLRQVVPADPAAQIERPTGTFV